MTAEELMTPRFQVIAEYPLCIFAKGKILVRIKGATNDIFHTNEKALVGGLDLKVLEEFPHLFRKMQWWEGRKAEEMPKKIKSLGIYEDVYEIEEWDMENFIGWISKEERQVTSLLTWKPEPRYIPVD